MADSLTRDSLGKSHRVQGACLCPPHRTNSGSSFYRKEHPGRWIEWLKNRQGIAQSTGRHEGKQTYFYRSLRVGKRVKKVYLGCGAAGQAAAEAEAARRQQRQADAQLWLDTKSRLESLVALEKTYSELCELLADATLLVVGFHRAKRSAWRPWNAARNIIGRAR